MEINQEREAFEAEFSKIKSDIAFWLHTWDEEMQGYNHPVMCWFWYMWQAKKQATPEGFVLELEKGRFVQYELIDLLTRSLSSSKVLKTNTNWVHVVRMLNVGSTVAHRICEKLGVDPESTKFEAQEQSHDEV